MKKNNAVRLYFLLITVLVIAGCAQKRPASHFYFVQLTDTHWGLPGDLKRTQKIIPMIDNLSLPVDFVVVTGDIIDSSATKQTDIDAGVKSLRKLKPPVWFVPGNHEKYGYDYDSYAKNFKSNFNDLNFSFENKGVVFISFDEQMLSDNTSRRDVSVKWLKNAICAANSKPIVIFMHIPPTGDYYFTTPAYQWTEKEKMLLSPILKDKNILAIICGHFHGDEMYWLGDIPVYVSPPVSSKFKRQGSFRIYEYKNGKIGYISKYLEK
jgi:3',5'-cyclic AMP phosphodiesterase CpdA